MGADLNVHWDMGKDGQPKPHAHVMLSMREISPDGFGKKVVEWNSTALLKEWREAWADHVNQRLAELDIDARTDHRTLAAQGIDLEPQHKIGPAASRMPEQGIEAERVEDHARIDRETGKKIIAQPSNPMDANTRQKDELPPTHHRTLAAQGIDLEPQHKIGPAASRMPEQGLEAERVEDHARIARENGEKIIARPEIALDAITRQQATFTRRDLAQFAFRHSDGKDQFDQVMSAVRTSPELVALGKDGRGEDRFTSRDMIDTEQRLSQAGDRLADRAGHGLSAASQMGGRDTAESGSLALGSQQKDALAHITGKNDLAIVVGYAGTGKSTMLGVARDEWERAGYQVRGAALSGIAAEGLEGGSGIQSRTIASMEYQWDQGRELDRKSTRLNSSH